MTKKIIAFGASTSKNSINKALAQYATTKIDNANIEILDLNDFEMPIYSIDRENESGIHELALKFKELIKGADGIIISFAEHNGAYSAAFKNIYDWVSRMGKYVWENKPMFLLATSPGPRGGSSVLNLANTLYKRSNSNTIVTFSLPSFYENFSIEEGIKDSTLLEKFNGQLNTFMQAL